MCSIRKFQKTEHPTESCASNNIKQEKNESSDISNIFDIPDEILTKIIMLLNPRERIPVGDTCRRFYNLVFDDTKSLRNLDFSKGAHLTKESHIRKYFDNENTRKHVLHLNISNVRCIEPGDMLNTSIGKALNLVEIKMYGMRFHNFRQFRNFFKPLKHVRRLSFDWTDKFMSAGIPLRSMVSVKPFSRLTYLEMRMSTLELKRFRPSLTRCVHLITLCIIIEKRFPDPDYRPGILFENTSSQAPNKFVHLESIEYHGPCVVSIKEDFTSMVSKPQEWIDYHFNSVDHPIGFYIVKPNVCKELPESEWLESLPKLGTASPFSPELLLDKVLRVKDLDVPEKFCCLSTFTLQKRCLFKLNEAKRLLEDPKYQISYLYLSHPIETGCDIHLVASALPHLTKLVLCAITRDLKSVTKSSHFGRRPKRNYDIVSGQEDDESLPNMDSSFQMLVKNTPNLRIFKLDGSGQRDLDWDLDELYSITGWKKLESLHLNSIPIVKGNCLIEIAKHCKNLQTLELVNLGTEHNYRILKQNVLEMLKYCKYLRNVKIVGVEMSNSSDCELFTRLEQNVHLKTVCLESFNQTFTIDVLISSIHRLLCKCPNLDTFVFKLDNAAQIDFDELWTTVEIM